MSWSLSSKLSRKEGFSDVDKNMEELMALDKSAAGNSDHIEERDAQIGIACKMASVLISTEPFQNAEEISITLSGHANAGHQKASGSASDGIQISAWVSKYREVTDANP